jgi:predicted transposase YbfD/YdcC
MEAGAGFGAHSEALVFLESFTDFPDPRQRGKVIYPLEEVLLLCLLAVLAGAETFVDIARFGQKKIELLRRFLPFRDGTPSHDQLGDIFATLDAAEFQRRFVAWVAKLIGVSADVIAIDGKTVRRSSHKRGGKAAIHMVSAFATRQRLVLGQVKVADKSNEIVAIPALLDMLAIEGAVVTIDAMGCQVEIADRIVAHKADYLLPLKGNQPTLEADVEDYFRTAPADELVSKTTVEKGHGRIETRTYTASSKVDWITSERSYPGQPRFKNINTVAKVHARAEYADRCSFDTHHYISSAPLDIERIARGARGHWGIESMHWLLDVEFKDDLSRYRTGHGAKNMTIVRRFALGLVRANKAKGSVKTRRKTAGWSPDFLLEILQLK